MILQGRFIFREVINLPIGWDDIVPLNIANRWRTWCNSLHHLSNIQISRTIVPIALKENVRTEMHVFSDASEKVVCAVAYLHVLSNKRQTYLGLLMRKSKSSPQHSNTIPRLELCAAVLSAEIASFVLKHIDTTIHEVLFTDSSIVLGYIHNQTRRFHTYVANRVQRIRQHSDPEQLNFISTEANPADVGSRGVLANELTQSLWFQEPSRLQTDKTEKEDYPLVNPDDDSEIKNVNVISQKMCVKTFEAYKNIEKFSSWTSLVRAFTVLRRAVRKKLNLPPLDTMQMNRATYLPDGIIRLGGRVRTGDALSNEHGPIIIHGKTHLARLLVQHCHETIKHQGRHLTEGLSLFIWILGNWREKTDLINHTFVCNMQKT